MIAELAVTAACAIAYRFRGGGFVKAPSWLKQGVWAGVVMAAVAVAGAVLTPLQAVCAAMLASGAMIVVPNVGMDGTKLESHGYMGLIGILRGCVFFLPLTLTGLTWPEAAYATLSLGVLSGLDSLIAWTGAKPEEDRTPIRELLTGVSWALVILGIF